MIKVKFANNAFKYNWAGVVSLESNLQNPPADIANWAKAFEIGESYGLSGLEDYPA